MKNLVIAVLLIASLGLGALLMQQHNRSAQAEAKLASLEKRAADAEAALAAKDSVVNRLQDQIEAAQRESAANAGAAAQLSLALTNTLEAVATPEPTTNAKPANPFAEMFKNPEMRDMIKQQQKTVMGGMVDKNYADFFKSMNHDARTNRNHEGPHHEQNAWRCRVGHGDVGGDMDADKRAELTKKMKETTDALNSQIKALLGDENYSLFQTYEKSIPDRMAVSQLETQLGDTMPLNLDQKSLLISAMSEERQGFKFTTDLGNQSNPSPDMMSRFTEENINKYLQEQDQLNQRYLARAQQILTPEQYTAYEKSLKNQQEMAKMGMKMAASMFGNKK